MPDTGDVVVVGAGIVGLATARAVQRHQPRRQVVVIDKEASVAGHQSGHNSGVIHSGLYYAPGSHKAALTQAGRAELIQWCDRNDVAWERCGKVVVATTGDEVERLDALAERARRNGVTATRLDAAGLADHEPHAVGLAALHVPDTAVVDYREVCRGLARAVEGAGGTVVLGAGVTGVERAGPTVAVHTTAGTVVATHVANCAGLASDRIARAAGDEPGASILPFRGEYHELISPRRHLVRSLIYPVPDPRFPFLGVHLSRGIDGHVHVGPNAVLATAREGYRWRDVNLTDLRDLLGDAAAWRLARRYWRTGIGEVARSLSRSRLVDALQRLVPDLTNDDLVRGGSGVRAQAVAPDGTLLDDFAFAASGPFAGGRVVHVLNAPSPAATASLAIGRVVAEQLLGPAADPTGPRAAALD